MSKTVTAESMHKQLRRWPDLFRQELDERAESQRARLFLAWSGALWLLFLGLAATIGRGRSYRWDLAIARKIQGLRVPGFATLMHLVSLPGFAPYGQAIVGTTALGLFFARQRLEAVFVALTWGAELIGERIKHRVRRQRPTAGVVRVFRPLRDPSFPSGHTLHYVAFYGFLAYLTFTRVGSTAVRPPLLAFCGLMIAGVGPSRVFRGDHWPSDVMASYCAGLPYLLGLIELYRIARSVRSRWGDTGPAN